VDAVAAGAVGAAPVAAASVPGSAVLLSAAAFAFASAWWRQATPVQQLGLAPTSATFVFLPMPFFFFVPAFAAFSCFFFSVPMAATFLLPKSTRPNLT
jgi:hypothetical protein